MKTKMLPMMIIALSLCSCSGWDDIKNTKVDRDALPERVDPPRAPGCVSIQLGLYEGDWVIYDSSEDHPRFNDVLTISETASGSQKYSLAGDVQIGYFQGGQNPFIPVCKDGKYQLEGYFQDHGCKHKATILLMQDTSVLSGVNCSQYSSSERQDCMNMQQSGFQKHIEIKFDHDPKGNCPVSHKRHAGVAHGGGTGTN